LLAAAAVLHDMSAVYKDMRFFYLRFAMKMGKKHLHHVLHALSFVTTSFSLVHALLQYRACLASGLAIFLCFLFFRSLQQQGSQCAFPAPKTPKKSAKDSGVWS